MTAPAIQGTPALDEGTSTTSPLATMPSGSFAVDDQLYILLVTRDRTITPPAGWSLLKEYQDVGFTKVGFYGKWSDGTEDGDVLTFTASSATPYASVGFRVTGGDLNRFTVSTGVDGAGTSISGDALTSDIDTEQLWLWCAGWVADDVALNAYPALYLDGRSHTVSGGGATNGAAVGFAARRIEAGSDTPGTATLASSEAWSTFTVALHPMPAAPSDPPSNATGLEVEVLVDGEWTAVGDTAIYDRDPVQIRHGRSGWASGVQPSTLTFTADNRTGAWSDFYAGSAVSSKLGRNTQMRAGAPQPDAFLEPTIRATGDLAGAYASDSVALSITGDIDLRAEVEMMKDVHSGFGYTRLIYKRGSYILYVGWESGTPRVRIFWTDSGGTHAYSHSLPWALMGTRFAVRFTLDVSTGEGISYWSDAIDGSWTQISTSSSAGATNIEDSANSLVLFGGDAADGFSVVPVRIYVAEVRDGIDGTVVANPDFTGRTPGAASFSDDHSNTWVIGPDARITSTRWRFHGELVDHAARWALSGNDQWAPFEAAGLQRRLRQGLDKPLQSALRRGYDRSAYASDIVAYWPMEEDGDASISQFGPAVGDQPLVRTTGDAQPAAYSGFPCSQPIPTMGAASFQAVMPAFSSTEWMVRMLLFAPTDLAGPTTFLEVIAGDLVWHVTYSDPSSGSFNVRVYTVNGVDVLNTTTAFGTAGIPVRLSLSASQNGADIDWVIATEDTDGNAGGNSGSISTRTLYRPHLLRLNKDLDADTLAIGHLSVESVVRAGDLSEELSAHVGETAANRVIRLADEEGLEVRIIGDPDDSVAMGPQRPLKLVDLLDECANTDLGVLFDPADRLAVGYRTGTSIRTQTDPVVLDYGAGEIDGVPQLDRDDRDFRNDVTVKNWDGATDRAEITSGELATTTLGRYDETFDVNVSDGTTLDDHAYTRLTLRSPTTARMDSLGLNFQLEAVTDALRRSFVELLPGDLIRVDNLPSTVHTDDLYQVVEGWTETIDHPIRTMRLATSAGDPWRVGIVEQTGDINYDGGFSITATAAEAGASTLYVATTSGPVWTTDSNDLPLILEVDGILVTVSAVSGSTSPQTFTVSALPRYVPGGATVRLAYPAYYSL